MTIRSVWLWKAPTARLGLLRAWCAKGVLSTRIEGTPGANVPDFHAFDAQVGRVGEQARAVEQRPNAEREERPLPPRVAHLALKGELRRGEDRRARAPLGIVEARGDGAQRVLGAHQVVHGRAARGAGRRAGGGLHRRRRQFAPAVRGADHQSPAGHDGRRAAGGRALPTPNLPKTPEASPKLPHAPKAYQSIPKLSKASQSVPESKMVN